MIVWLNGNFGLEDHEVAELLDDRATLSRTPVSGSSEKAHRRDIRRAFGPEAVHAIQSRDTTIRQVQQQLHTVDAWTQHTFSLHADRLVALEHRPDPVTFCQRVRWLITGRV